MKLIKTQSELQEFFDKQKFVEDTCLQIIKDLGGLVKDEYNFMINHNGDVRSQLVDTLTGIIQNLSSSQIKQFLYRVDLNEQKMNDFISQKNDYQNLADEIILREAQKVYLRSRLKS